MRFGRYLLRRVLFALLLVFIVSSAALLLTLVAPGAFGSDEEWIARNDPRSERPLGAQYVEWISRAIRFDFGQSLLYTRPVSDLLSERALNTAVLATSALAIATIIGIPLGVYTGTRRRGWGVRLVRFVSVMFLSTPPLIASLGLILVAARTGWFPLGGMVSASAHDAAWAVWLGDILRHVTLPALALALPLAATLERLQSQAMTVALREPFVAAAAARGLSTDQAALRHGWPVSLGAVLGVYGLMIGTLFSGSFIVEVVTSWPGLGRLMYDGLRARDLYLVAGCSAAGAVFLAAGTLLSDLLLAIADPRVRLGIRP
jgi:peptide/nickel transport system permease protein